MLSGPVELLVFVDLMARCTCSIEIRMFSVSSWFVLSRLVLRSMRRFVLCVLCAVEFTNCWLKDWAMFFAVDLSLLLN